MSRPIHFEIHASNRQHCIDFYTKGVGWLAYAHDSEGNIFGVMQFDAAAK